MLVNEVSKAQKPRQQCESGSDRLFDSCGIVHQEYTLEGQTINEENDLEVPHRHRDAVERKRLEMWAEKKSQLYRSGASLILPI